MRRYSGSRGFTLVELLVVIAIIGTLAALLLPAIQQARETANRIKCTNNMKNLALACAMYHDSQSSFPSGWIVSDDATSIPPPNWEGWGWGALILPFLEQRNLHRDLAVGSYRLDQILAGNNPDARLQGNISNMRKLIQTPLKIFICPSDTGANGTVDPFRALSGVGARASGSLGISQGVSNYVGVAGHRRVTGTTKNTGTFYGNSRVSFSDILDGTSNTAILGERDTQYCHSGTWVGTQNTFQLDSFDVSMVTGYNQPQLNAPPDTSTAALSTMGPTLCGEGFSSLHVGGALFAFADGSVRFLSNGTDYWYVNNGGGVACTATTGPYANDHKVDDNIHHKPNGVYQRMMSISDKLTAGNLP